MPVVDEGLIRNADQLDVAFAGVILSGEPVHSAVVAAPVGIVEVPDGEDAVAKGKDGPQVVHQLHFQVFRGGGFGQAVGCGECVLACPVGAWRRSEKKYYRLTLMGRTGKKNPRLGEDFIIWADEESIIRIILNTYDYVKEYIDLDAPGGKEHIGYIIDRTGFEEWKKWAFKDVVLPDKAVVRDRVYWDGVRYAIDNTK